ncbi:hypothetical protein LUZ60_004597 [Juncus effusus]|nr:hypothetical protein LUZ60_004597 [Juncus effusus]
MRLKKGSRIEVLQDGLWSPARILCGNGHTYSVQYDHETKGFQKVPRKSIRPSPPLKEKLIKWKSGDLVEVLIHGSWRQAKVTAVAFGNTLIFVMLIDGSRELAVKRNNVRLRYFWHNDKWIVVKKDSERTNEMKKRKLDDFDCRGDAKKPRLEFDEVIQGEKYMNNNNNSCESESTVSSSGSCSTSGGPYNYTPFSWADDDAMSSCEPIKEKKSHLIEKEKRGEELFSIGERHKLELDEYNATLGVFYKSGFLTWEQEGILSNLRLSLNISLDEHKSVLKSLGLSRR